MRVLRRLPHILSHVFFRVKNEFYVNGEKIGYFVFLITFPTFEIYYFINFIIFIIYFINHLKTCQKL